METVLVSPNTCQFGIQYDYFDFNGIQQLSFIPLPKLLTGLGDDHWLRRHPRFSADKFLIFDEHQQLLRLRVDSEYSSYCRLCASLFQEILVLKTVRLVPGVWQHITQPPFDSSMDWTRRDFFVDVGITDVWHHFYSVTHRQQ
ncbi:hypothetical protein BD408DRAFT_211876 [Parasitella parasitica]|nr:hypothetical protein BD408DRAFT_211876 [Parasitella parasitica]